MTAKASSKRFEFMRYLFLVAVVAAAAASSMAASAAAPSTKLVEPALAPVPEVEAAIRSLKPNQIIKLPEATITGDFNDIARHYRLDKTGPTVRNYCLKMAWAADRKRALFCGGNHGTPHGLNDIWEYDLPSNTWLLLWAPDDFTRKPHGRWEDAIIKDGVLQSKRGATARASHTWDQMTYDPEIGSLVWLTAWNIEGFLRKHGLAEQLQAENRHHIPLWGYSPSKNQWTPLGLDQKTTQGKNASLLCYIPGLNGVIYYGKGTAYKTFLWDNRTDKWSLYCERPEVGQSPMDEMISCYDPKNKLVVAVRASNKHGGGTYHFDPASKSWRRTVRWGEAEMPLAQDMDAVIGCDPATGQSIVFANMSASFGFWAYRPDTTQWRKLAPEGDIPVKVPKRFFNGYFDLERGVFVLFLNAGKQVWAYRPPQLDK